MKRRASSPSRRRAKPGIEKLTLVEEPAAAFYSWIANHLAQSQKSLFDGQMVLVCDVGGGTSDFTLIRVGREGDRIEFTRTAVGKHLLLGGDNLDLTLAWLVEAKLGAQLSIRQRSALAAAMRGGQRAAAGRPESAEGRDHGAGRGLVADWRHAEDARSCAKRRWNWRSTASCRSASWTKSRRKRSAACFGNWACPYVSDPAITRHLAAFLSANENARPDAILFNGGFFIPEICQQRVADVMERWFGQRPLVLENRDLDLAVAVGASYYSYVRSTGAGLLVRGGLPRSYYIGIGENEAVCLLPRGTEEGATLEIDSQDLHLVANKPVSFRLYSSLARPDDVLGQTLSIAETGGPAPACAAERRDPLRQAGRAAGAGEDPRASDRSGHAGAVGRFEDQRAPLALAVRAAQDRAAHASPRPW